MQTQIPQILVVASSGTLAKFIIDEVIHSFGMESLSISDYKNDRLQTIKKELKEKYGKEPEARLIDMTSIESIKCGLEHVDYVIVPASQKRPLVQEACIQKGKVCIDLAVSEEFIDEAIKLQTEACNGKSLLLMAAGLFPGLSGIIAKTIHNNKPDTIIDIGLIQSKDGVSGSTGIADMLQLFNQNVNLITPSKTFVKRGFSYSKAFRFDDRFGKKYLRLSHFIERKYLQQRLNITTNYWSAFDSEKFNKLIAFARRIGFLNLFGSPKYRLVIARFISKKRKIFNGEVVGVIGQTDDIDRFVVFFESDYAATASCAVAFVKILAQNNKKLYGVYFPFEIIELNEVLQNIEHRIVNPG